MTDMLKQKLAEAGIPVEGWQNTQGGTRPLPESVLRQREALGVVKMLLEKQIADDLSKVAELHEQISRLKHGGGR